MGSEMETCRFQSGGWCTRPDGHEGAHNQHGNPRDRESDLVAALRAEAATLRARVAQLEAMVAVERGLAQDAEGRWTAAAADRDRLRARVRELGELLRHVYHCKHREGRGCIDGEHVAAAAFLAWEDGTP